MVSTARTCRIPPRAAIAPLELMGESPAMALVRDRLRGLAESQGNALFVAEAGIDLEPVARWLHAPTAAKSAPYLALDCGRGAPDSLEEQLFGGTTTSSNVEVEGVSPASSIARLAHGGTLFLQDVSELPAGAQSRLARIIRDGEVSIGERRVRLETRLFASARPEIDRDVRTNRFRRDLYRRLADSRIDWPPLRARRGDIPALVGALVAEWSARSDASASLSDAAVGLLSALAWPGNLLELRAALESVLTGHRRDPIDIGDLVQVIGVDVGLIGFVPEGSLRDARLRFEREYILSVLRYHNWRVADAAQTLGIQRPNLYRKARQLHIAVTGPTS
jgi:two-component system, NtrC family, nitrogen regulation response regulator NtrX